MIISESFKNEDVVTYSHDLIIKNNNEECTPYSNRILMQQLSKKWNGSLTITTTTTMI